MDTFSDFREVVNSISIFPDPATIPDNDDAESHILVDFDHKAGIYPGYCIVA